MTQVTYFVVQPFEQDKRGGLIAKQPQQVQTQSMAISRAKRLAEKGGAVAFSRTGDLSTGDFDDAVVLGQFGLVPEELFV